MEWRFSFEGLRVLADIFFYLLISYVRHRARHFHPSIHLFNNYCLSWTTIPSREGQVRPRLVLVMMQTDGLCGRRKVWNLPASWKNKPCTQWLARSVSGVASQSDTCLWEELNSSLEWSENVSQRRFRHRGNYSALHFGNGRGFIMVRWRLVLPREGGVMVSAEASSWATVVCFGVECGLPGMMDYYLGFESDKFVVRLGSNYESHLMAA